MRRLQGPKLRAAIPCGYCFQEWAYCYDHILPVAHGGTNRKSNLYPACRRCNALLCDKVFGSLEEKRDYVQAELKRRGEWTTSDKMREMRGGVCTQEEVAEVLQPSLPMATVERSPSQSVVSTSSTEGNGILAWFNRKRPMFLYSKEKGYYE